jgi:hypothetical protein
MLRLLVKLALAAAAVAAVLAFVPVGGRTVAARWRSARTPSEFVDRAWGELRAAVAEAPGDRSPARPHARTGPPPAPGRTRPAEKHTEADREAVDRIVAEHLAGSR